MTARQVLLVLAFLTASLLALDAKGQSFYAYYNGYAEEPAPAYQQSYARPDVDEDAGPSAPVMRGGSQPMVEGSRAIIRNGVAYAPASAPDSVKHAIWAANALRRKPYKWGGGHGSFFDSGYDCSGTVSYALHYAGLVSEPMPSSDFLRFGEQGRGRWITVYARNGHTFAVIAGLRLDTTGPWGTEGPRWHSDIRETWGFEARHPSGL
jgi:hypothetical protein